MPLPGGPTDKAGNRYEQLWTVHCLLDVLQGRARSIRLEAPGAHGEGFEFVVRSERGAEWHQAKRQRSRGSWTLASLKAEGVLAALGRAVARGEAATFVSGTSAADLAELIHSVQGSASYPEFRGEFLNTPDRLSNFEVVVEVWALPAEQVYGRLQRVRVTTITEDILERGITDRCAALVTGSPDAVVDALMRLVGESVHADLTEADVWAFLRPRGHEPSPWADQSSVELAVQAAFERYLEIVEQGAIDGRLLERSETLRVIEHLQEGMDVALTGAAGHGKTGVVAGVIRNLSSQGWRVLPIRVDRLGGAHDTAELGVSLGLPGSPAHVLGAVDRASLMVIDQLDAVSTVSGRSTERFEVMAELLRETASFPHVRAVVATRTFDLRNDDRFRFLLREPRFQIVDVDLLPRSVVNEWLQEEAHWLPQVDSQLPELLRSPLHLRLYSELVRGSDVDVDARTERDLLDRFWDLKRQQVRDRRGGDDQWIELVDVLVEYMSDRAALSAPAQIADTLDRQREAMISEGVLTSDGNRLGFFHERFFDYCYARRFVGRGLTLQALLTGGDQDLFRRAQVRQVLAHERGDDQQAYSRDLRWLLSSPDVRPHLRALVIDWLADLPEPDASEWRLLRPLLDEKDRLEDRVWRIFRGSARWFEFADDESLWQEWLDGEGGKADRACWALHSAGQARAERVAALLADRPGSTEEWAQRLAALLLRGELTAERPLFEVALRCIDVGDFDGQDRLVWHAVEELIERRPGWAGEMAEAWLRRRVLPGWINDLDPFTRVRADDDGTALEKLAVAGPGEVVARLLPLFLEVIEAISQPHHNDAGIAHDRLWSYQIYNADHGLEGSLFRAFQTAMTRLAHADPDLVADPIRALRDSRVESAWFLLAQTYASNPHHFASAAVNWMTHEPGALRLGYSDAPEWVSRELIAAVSPLCSEAKLAELERALLDFSTPWERSVHGFRARGLAQFALLEGIDPQRRSATVQRRLAEHERKFGDRRPRPPQGIYGGFVGSPITPDRTRRMTDRQWQRAMRRYSSDEMRPSGDSDLVGGADQLATQLEAQTKDDPERFARFLLAMPDDVNPAYPGAVLRALREAAIDVELVAAVCRSSVRFADTTRWLPWFLEPRAHAPLPDDVLLLVAQAAQQQPDPASDVWRVRRSGTVEERMLDLDTATLNSTRGYAAYTMGALIADDAHRLALFLPALRHACQDSVMAVRAGAAHGLLGVMRLDMDLAAELLVGLVSDAPDEIFLSRYVDQAVHWAVQLRLNLVRPILERPLACADDAVKEAGGRHLMLASLVDPELDPQIDEYLAVSHPASIGVATVAAANVAGSIRRDRCIEITGRALGHPMSEVRDAASSCFTALEGVPLYPYSELFRTFAESPSVTSNVWRPLHVLENSLQHLPETALMVCEAFVRKNQDSISDLSTSAAAHAHEVSRIVLRLHAQHEEPAIRNRCLDLIDELVTQDDLNVHRELAQLER